ncbi:kinase-like protein [Pyrenochaeta sp. DS3sAY3a]|nr:kinase-like protein [Pyrenochaeta sp. DS3sAY3a]
MAPSNWDGYCERARGLLATQEVFPRSTRLPHSDTSYFPRSNIVKILSEFPVAKIFTCPCARCKPHSTLYGGRDHRSTTVDEGELLGQYATIYGLLIYLRHPFLISLFQQHRIYLKGRYLTEEDLDFLSSSERLDKTQLHMIRSEIVRYQYRFFVRTFQARNAITYIPPKEVIPIQEEDQPRGRGDFGEVYAFDIPDEYLDESLRSRQATTTETKRFARKIFNREWTHADPAEEWVKHLYANSLKHENLLEALAAFNHGSYFFIVFELAQCTLSDILNGNNSSVPFTSPDLWQQICGLARGLEYLHGKRVCGGAQGGRMFHLDLKPSNVLIVNKTMKIADFGLSNYKPDPQLNSSRVSGSLRHDGALAYSPPSGKVDDKYDVYSLGAIFSEVACMDIGEAHRVAKYRDRRKADLDERPEEASEQFFYPATQRLKNSVQKEHLELCKEIKRAGKRPSNTSQSHWKQEFFV